MADRKGTESGTTGARERPAEMPGANRLAEELQGYVQARVEKTLGGLGDRMGSAATKLGAAHLGPRGLAHAIGFGGGKHTGGSPHGSVLSTAASTVVGGAASHAKEAVVNKVKEAVSGGGGKKAGAGAGGKSMSVIEDVDVGVPVREAYDQWTQFQEFGSFAKGVVSVEQKDETTSHWEVKIAKSSRAWEGTVTEQVPDERIAWTSEGAKGTTRGVVTFHPLGDNLTKVLLVMEYFPKGVVEKTGNLWRAQGRRARLDLKAFRKFVMMRGEATGAWRGEIRDGEVVRSHEEAEQAEEEARAEAGEGREEGQGADEGGGEARGADRGDERGTARDEDEPHEEDEPYEDEEREEDEEDGGGYETTGGRIARAEEYEDEEADWDQDLDERGRDLDEQDREERDRDEDDRGRDEDDRGRDEDDRDRDDDDRGRDEEGEP
ncbi:SRPBCC family protein [Streptomyces fradiae]|uniref:SRPBCC family protein n=1 Tax=Streptomyces fradiae TaxID=1906 RepID=UPI0036F62DD3